MKLVVKNRAKLFISISACILLIALVMSLFGYGINYGIDFAGGLNIEYNMNSTFLQSDVEAALKNDRPRIAHDAVMAQARATIEKVAAAKRKKSA